MLSVSLGTIANLKTNWKQCLCKILRGKHYGIFNKASRFHVSDVMKTLVICSRVSDFQVTTSKKFVDIFKIVDWTKQRKQFSRDVVFVGTLIFNRSWTTTNHSTRNIVFTTFHNKDHFTCLHTTRDIQRETQLVLATWLLMNLTILLFPFNPWKL